MPDESEYQLSEYELLRLERIKRNQARLEELGLVDKPWNNKQQPKKKKKKTTPRKKAKTPRPGQERRSKRLSKAPPGQLLQLSNHHEDEVVVEQDADFDTDADEEKEPYEAKISVRQVRRQVNLDRDKYSVSKEDMQNLRGGMDAEAVIAKLQEFLRYHDKISDSNERRVMPQASKLLRGEGIGYIHWKGKMFHKGDKITLMDDIVALYDEAIECEDKWGKDLGNGWLLKHPLKKLLIFQSFCLKNVGFLGSTSKIKEYCEGEEQQEEGHGAMDAEEDERKPAANGADDAVSNKSSKDDSATADTAGAPDSDDSAKEKDKSKSAAKPTKGTTNKYIDARIAKNFDAGLFFGTITKHYPKHDVWFVEYDDGDEEEFDADELDAALRLYKKKSSKDSAKRRLKQDTSGGKRASTDANAEATPTAKKRKKTANPRTSARRSPRCVAGI